MKCKVNITNCAALFIIVFSGFYLKTVAISPIYLTTSVGILLYVMVLIKEEHPIFIADYTVWFAVVWLIYILITQSVYLKTSAFYNLLFSILYYIFSFQVVNRVSREKVLCYSKKMVDFSIVLLLFEAVSRIGHPVVKAMQAENNAFYKYKYNSIMYQDSNYVGIFIIVLFFFALYLDNKQNVVMKKERIVLLCLCIATFSRSAIIVILLFGFWLDRSISKSKKIIILFGAIIAGAYFISDYILNDGSFLSKFSIIESAWTFYTRKASLAMQLFGYGLGHSADNIGIGSHNLFVAFIMETGVIGFLLFVTFWLCIAKKTNGKATYVIVPILTAGFSFVQHFLPFLYVVFVIIIALENSNGFLKSNEDVKNNG